MKQNNGSGRPKACLDLAPCREHACIWTSKHLRSPEYASKDDLRDGLIMFEEMDLLNLSEVNRISLEIEQSPLPKERRFSSPHGIFEQACTMAEFLQGLYESNGPKSVTRPRECETRLHNKYRPA